MQTSSRKFFRVTVNEGVRIIIGILIAIKHG